MVRVLLPFVAGVLLVVITGLSLPRPGLALVPAFLLLLLTLSQRVSGVFERRRWFGVAFSLFMVAAGVELTNIRSVQYDHRHFYKVLAQDGLLIGEVLEEPRLRAKSVQAQLEIQAIRSHDRWLASSGKLLVNLALDSAAVGLAPGDRLLIQPDIRPVSGPTNPNTFDYRQYLAFHLVHQQAFLQPENWIRLRAPAELPLSGYTAALRRTLIEVLDEHLDDERGQAVASALILGYKDKLDEDLQTTYAGAGAMHVLAVSGLHVGIIYLVFATMLRFFDRLKRGPLIKVILLLILLWGYAMLTGLSPSVLRATTMFSFILVGQAFRRQSNIYNSIACSAFVLLLLNPYLLMQVGFQLSYVAVLGIVWLYPLIYKSWYLPNKWIDKVWSLTAVSLAAQVATFPLALYYFHQFPNYFLLSNYIVIPCATAILYLGLLLFLVAPLELLAEGVAVLLDWALAAMNRGVEWVQSLPHAVTEDVYLSIGECMVIYGIILALGKAWQARSRRWLQGAMLLGIIFLSLRIGTEWERDGQRQFVIYDVPRHTALNFIDGRDNILFSSLAMSDRQRSVQYRLQPHWLALGLSEEKHLEVSKLSRRYWLTQQRITNNSNLFIKECFLQFHGCRVGVWDGKIPLPDQQGPLEVDVLVLRDNAKVKVEDLRKSFRFRWLVADASNSTYCREQWRNDAAEQGVFFWSVRDDGAWILNL